MTDRQAILAELRQHLDDAHRLSHQLGPAYTTALRVHLDDLLEELAFLKAIYQTDSDTPKTDGEAKRSSKHYRGVK